LGNEEDAATRGFHAWQQVALRQRFPLEIIAANGEGYSSLNEPRDGFGIRVAAGGFGLGVIGFVVEDDRCCVVIEDGRNGALASARLRSIESPAGCSPAVWIPSM
jgi:hypothetical protein